MKKYTIILVIAMITLTLSACAPASAPADVEESSGVEPLSIVEESSGVEPISIVEQYVELVNKGQISQVMKLFTGDASYETLGQGVVSGTEDLRSFCEYTVALNTELSLGYCSVEDLQVTCTVEETNDLWQAEGHGALDYRSVVFTITPEGMIGGIVASPDSEDTTAFNEIFQDFAASVIKNHPEEAAQLFGSDEMLIHTRDNAVTVVRMMREWQPLWVVERITTAFNAGDVEAILAFYASDIQIIFITGATDPWNGLDEARDFLEWHAYLAAQMTVADCEYDGESRVNCTMTFTDNWIEAAGLPTYVFPGLRFEFNEQGQVLEIVTRVDAATATALSNMARVYVPWVNHNYPEEAEIIFDPFNNFIFEYNLEAAEIQDLRIREWKQSADS